MEINEIETEINVATQTADAMTITCVESYTAAGEFWNRVKSLREKIAETFDPIISKAHAAHKEAVAQKKKHDEPLERAQRIVKSRMIAYDDEQERLRKAEELRLQAEADAKAKAEKEELERLLKETGMAEAAQEVAETPLERTQVVLPRQTPKIEGYVPRTVYSANVVDLLALVKAVAEGRVSFQAIEPNFTFLNTQARAFKSTVMLAYPGVEVVERKV